MDVVWKQKFRVFAFDVGLQGLARPESLMNYLQEAAGAHAASWKISVTDLLSQGRTWMLSRYHLKVARYPRLGEELEVTTWPSGREGLFATREFEIRGRDGEAAALATSSWVVLDLRQRKPVPVAEVTPESFARPVRCIEDTFPSLPKLEAAERETRLKVLARDLDINRHVNHTVYVQWALEALPRELLLETAPAEIEVAYRAEAFYGDEIAARAQVEDAGRSFRHQIVNASTGAELARLRTLWRG